MILETIRNAIIMVVITTDLVHINHLHQNWIPIVEQLKKYCLLGLKSTIIIKSNYTAGGFVWCDRPFYLLKQSQEKWACDFHDDATPLSFQLQVTEVIFLNLIIFS